MGSTPTSGTIKELMDEKLEKKLEVIFEFLVFGIIVGTGKLGSQ